MNSMTRKSGFFIKPGMAVIVMLFAQHALAAGTTAGTDIDNLASVDYFVNGVDQTDIESAPGVGNANPGVGNGQPTTFEVDNRVDFSLLQVGGAHTVVTAGQTDQFVEFLLTNVGNSVQDFRLVATQLSSPDAVFGLTDTDDDIGNLRIRVGPPGAIPPPPLTPPTTTSDDFVDELGEDQAVTIYLFGDDLGGLVDGDVMNIDLLAVVAEGGTAGGGVPGADLVDGLGSPDDPAVIDIVFSDGAGGLGTGTATDRHGFVFQSAGLNVTKVATVLSDPFNGTSNPKAIPGAIVEYVITVANSGALAADQVVITDAIDADIPAVPGFITGAYSGQDMSVINGGGAPLPCIADAVATDGCTLVGQDLTIGGGTTAISVAAGTSLVIMYRVLIP